MRRALNTMAESLTDNNHTAEEDNNNCIVNDKDCDDVTSFKPVIKFDSLIDRQLRITSGRKTGDDKSTNASYLASENENNYGLSLSQCDCCPETIAIPDDSDKINAEITVLPPAIKEWILKTKNRIAEIDKLHSASDATITAENNVDLAVKQGINAAMDCEASWIENFELKLSDEESRDKLENDENHDSNNDAWKDNIKDTEPSELPTMQNSCKDTEARDVVTKDIVEPKVENNIETTPKMISDEKKDRKTNKNLANFLNYNLSSPVENVITSEIRKPTVETNEEIAITKLSNETSDNMFNAKVVLKKLPSSLSPPSKLTTTETPKELASHPRKTQKFQRYCSNCKLTVDELSKQNDIKCSKCTTILIFMCTNCNSQFENHHKLIYHRTTKCSVVKQFDCDHCGYKTPVKSHMAVHVIRKHLNKENAKYSKPEEELKLKVNSRKRVVKDSKDNVAEDSKVETESKPIERYCPKCRKTITGTFTKNCPRCKNPLEFSCLKCHDTFSKHNCIVHHLKADCDRLFNKRFHCQNCIRLPIDTKNCQFCHYKANTIFNLIKHLQLYHTKRTGNGKISRYMCTCGKTFSHKSIFRGHEKLCGKHVTMLKCKLCDFENTFTSNIKRHMTLVHKKVSD